MKRILLLISISFFINSSLAQTLKTPSFEDVISLRSVSNAVTSPDGKHIVFITQSVDWKENRYDRELWLSKNGETPFQITNTLKNSSSNPKWSPDSKWIAFLSNRGEKTQIQAIRVAGGESFQVTKTENNISNFEWSPNGNKISFLQSEDKSKEVKKRKEKYGGFAVEDSEYNLNQLWVIDFNPKQMHHMPLPYQIKDSLYTEKLEPKLLINEKTFSINNFKWSPDGKKIAFEHQPDPLRNTFFKADISCLLYTSPSPRD